MTIQLNIEDICRILDLLAAQPYAEVANLIRRIKDQILRQL